MELLAAPTPKQMDEVIPGLYIGDQNAATDQQLLKEHNIVSVVSVMNGSISIQGIASENHLQIDVEDDEEADLLTKFNSTNAFIKAALTKGSVLVHWYATSNVSSF